jgi:hypothetical protein
MTSTTEAIETRWRALVSDGEADQREVDASSPLRMLIGVTTRRMPYFAVVTKDRPGQPDLGGTVHVERRRRNDTRWVLKLELQAGDLTDAFIALLTEVAQSAAPRRQRRAA